MDDFARKLVAIRKPGKRRGDPLAMNILDVIVDKPRNASDERAEQIGPAAALSLLP